jgi:putative phage-type endonuclease
MTTAVHPVRLAEPDDRADWLAARRQGIGASEIAAVLGISPWESPFSLYHRKVNGWEVEASDEMSAGLILEDAITHWWSIQHIDHGLHARRAGLYAHPERPWQLATPDRLVYAPREDRPAVGHLAAVLELKYVAHSWDGWGDADTDDIPVHYRAQVLWQCDVMGVDEWFLAALGPGGFRAYRGRRDEKDLIVMREAGRRFMARIEADDPPDVDDHRATLAAVKRVHSELVDEIAEIPAEVATLYRRAGALKKQAERLHASAEAKLRVAMGSAARAEHNGAFVASRSIYEVAESVRKGYMVDRLNPARSKK